jgi:hypothetical protein
MTKLQTQLFSCFLSLLLLFFLCEPVLAVGDSKNALVASSSKLPTERSRSTSPEKKQKPLRASARRHHAVGLYYRTHGRSNVITAAARDFSDFGFFESEDRARLRILDAKEALAETEFPTVLNILEQVESSIDDKNELEKFQSGLLSAGLAQDLLQVLPLDTLGESIIKSEDTELKKESLLGRIAYSLENFLPSQMEFQQLTEVLALNREKFFLLIASGKFDAIETERFFKKEAQDLEFSETKYLKYAKARLDKILKDLEKQEKEFYKTDYVVHDFLSDAFRLTKRRKNLIPPTVPELRETLLRYAETNQPLEDMGPSIALAIQEDTGALFRLCLSDRAFSMRILIALRNQETALRSRINLVSSAQAEIESLIKQSRRLSQHGYTEFTQLLPDENMYTIRIFEEHAQIFSAALQFYNPGIQLEEVGLYQQLLDNKAKWFLGVFWDRNIFLRKYGIVL